METNLDLKPEDEESWQGLRKLRPSGVQRSVWTPRRPDVGCRPPCLELPGLLPKLFQMLP